MMAGVHEHLVDHLKWNGEGKLLDIGNLEKRLEFIPGFVTTPWMISGMGILYGKK